jgi:rare lipoprotein A
MKSLIVAFLLVPLVLIGAIASWYGEEHRGHIRADGRPFDPDSLSAASWNYPLGTVLEVQHESRRVFVVVNDRGPARWVSGVDIDLSRRAFEMLAPLSLGRIPVTITIVKPAT